MLTLETALRSLALRELNRLGELSFRELRFGGPGFREIGLREISMIMRLSRRWLHYGLFAHTIICVVVGAIEGLLGRF